MPSAVCALLAAEQSGAIFRADLQQAAEGARGERWRGSGGASRGREGRAAARMLEPRLEAGRRVCRAMHGMNLLHHQRAVHGLY